MDQIGKQGMWGDVDEGHQKSHIGPKGAHLNEEVARGQHCGGSTAAFPGKSAQLGASSKCCTLTQAAWGTNRSN